MERSTVWKCISVYSQIYCSALQPQDRQGSAARNMIGYHWKSCETKCPDWKLFATVNMHHTCTIERKKISTSPKTFWNFPNMAGEWNFTLGLLFVDVVKKICLYYDKDDYGYNEDTQHVLRSVWAWQKFSVENPEHNSECGTEVSQCGKYSYGRSSSKGAKT